MSNGIPTPWDLYAASKYHYPRFEMQPVVRIPIAGHSPFNTLAVVRGKVFTTEYRYADGKLRRWRVEVGTNFSLVGFDPRIPPPFKHSTTVALQMIQTDQESPFVTAVDEVDGYFSDIGGWVVVVNTADLWETTIATASAYISSWVMCYEPPPENLPHGSARNVLTSPSSLRTIERLSVNSSSERELDRLVKRSLRRRGNQIASGNQE